jgi:precorrin-6B methylase 2
MVKRPLHWLRGMIAEAVAAAVERRPGLENSFVRTGRALARRSRAGGGLYWLAQEALMKRLRRNGNRYRDVTVKGLPMTVDITNGTGRHPFFYATPYEKAVTDAIVTALKPGDAFLDVGADIGYFSILAARVVGPSGCVIAFEPQEEACAALGGMLERNQIAGIVEIVPLALAGLEPGHSGTRSTTLDAWLAARPDVSGRVRCIKIDVGGGEAQVLAGMRDTLRPAGLTVICETTMRSEADETLVRAGFQRHRIERGTHPHGNFLYVRPGRPLL